MTFLQGFRTVHAAALTLLPVSWLAALGLDNMDNENEICLALLNELLSSTVYVLKKH